MGNSQKQLTIGKLTLSTNLVLAPMAGYTDVGFRSLCATYGASMCTTEMVSAQGLCYDNHHSHELLTKENNEGISCIQLFGSKSESIKTAVSLPVIDSFDVIDINCGCPVKKIYGNGDGSALLENIHNAQKVVKSAIDNPYHKPVTVKMRLGINDTSIGVDFAKSMEDIGVSAITVHGRTKKEGYSGNVHLDEIFKIRQNVSCTLIGNGDVKDYTSYQNMLSTGVDGVMIGRGALGKPYIFKELLKKDYVFNIKDAILYHIACLLKVYDGKTVANLMKKHICFYGSGYPFIKQLKTEINSQIDINKVYEIIEKYFTF